MIKGLYKLVRQSVDECISEGLNIDGISTDRVIARVKEKTMLHEWPLEEMFEFVISAYAAIALNERGFRSGKRGLGIYFNMDTNVLEIDQILVDNASDSADRYTAKANEVAKRSGSKILVGLFDGQFRMLFDDDKSLLGCAEERTIEKISEIIRQLEANTV